MEPQEIDTYLFNNSFRGLIFFTGLDLSGNNAQHSAIYNAFNDQKRERTMQFQYKILTAENELFQRRDSSIIQQQNERSSESPALLRRSSQFHGIIKRRWPHKYLENRPALIVAFTDLDWDSPAWFEKRTECESKINTLRQSIGQREIRLVLVLVQHQKTSLEDPVAAEKAMEMCQHCRLSSRLLFVFPLLTDPRATFECVSRLEMSFNEIAQDAYQATFKRIRARNVPNNDQSLLLRQQFKLAFISELREDRHSALRYYKQAYQICAELNVPDVDVYEIFTVASLLNYKICELNFLLNSPVEALNQFRKHAANFFSRQPGVYPSRELAAIEFYWWASQQCRIFAEIFNRAVTNGLAAYASQNPGRFLEEAATYYKKANSLVRQIRQRLAIGENQQQRQTSPPIGGDPLQSFDLNAPVLYFGQRPWRTPNGIAIRASSEPNTRPGGMLAPILGNPQLIEHAAKQFLEKNVRENYAHTLQLFSTAITQFKRYHCDRFATLAYLDMADEYIASRQIAKALQILRHLSIEFRSTSFHPFLRNVLIKAFNTAFCVCNLDEWICALAQLLPSKLWDEKNATAGSLTSAEEIQEDFWLATEKYLRGEFKSPFPIHHNDLFPKEEIDSARQIWHQIGQQAPTPTPSQPQQFKLDLSQFGKDAFLHCKVHFLTFADGKESPPQIIHAGEPLLIEVILHNNSSVPLCFQRCSLVLEQFSIATGKNSLILDDWHNAAGGKGEPITMASNGGNASLFFLFRPTLSQIFASQQQPQSRAQSPSVPNKRCELDISIRLFSIDASNGTFFWDFEQASSNLPKGPIAQTNSLTIKVIPQLKEIKLSRTGFGPTSENIRLFTDESIDLAFTLENSGNASEDLKNVRILCHKVYREEEFNQLPNTPMVQHTFAAPCNIPTGNPQIAHQQNEFSTGHGHTLVPIFNQEIATFLGQGESTDFSVRLQSKSNNCIALQFQICSQLAANGEPVEWVKNFPIICMEPFKMETTVYCENGQRAQCLVGGQKYRIEVDIESTTNSMKILDLQWKLNASSIQKPLSAILSSQFENLSISSAKENQKTRKEIWIRLPNSEGIHDETQMALGDVVVEWSSSNSSEPIRSLFNIGQLPIGSSPINIQVEFLQQEETATEISDEFHFIVGRPFGLRFSLWNSMENMQPLAIQLCFDQVDGFIFSGIKEDYLTLMPDGEPHVFVQTIIALCPGQLAFPRPSIRCTNSLPGRPSFDFSHEELERLNRKIAANTFNALPTTIFVMP